MNNWTEMSTYIVLLDICSFQFISTHMKVYTETDSRSSCSQVWHQRQVFRVGLGRGADGGHGNCSLGEKGLDFTGKVGD